LGARGPQEIADEMPKDETTGNTSSAAERTQPNPRFNARSVASE